MNEALSSIRPRLDRVQRLALIAGGVGLAICVVGLVIGLGGEETLVDQFFRSYLIGFIFTLGLALGSLGILMLHNMVLGPWGYVVRRVLEAAIRTLPLMAVLFIPLLFGIHSLYEWSHEDVVATDTILQHKSLYLNETFFIVRSVIYFLVWIGLGVFITRQMRRLEDAGGSVVTRRIQSFSAIGLLLFFLTATFAAFDWMMSIEPHWFSSIYGLLVIVGWALSTWAMLIIWMVYLADKDATVAEAFKPQYRHDLGNFMFAFTLLWAYLSASQLIIIYAGNLPEETPWYIRRATGGWELIPIILALFHFFAPFILLLMVKLKRNPKTLMWIAFLIMVMHLVDIFWLIAPGFQHGDHVSFHMHWLDIAAPLGFIGLWVAFFVAQLKRGGSLLPLNIAYPKQEAELHG